MRFRVLDAPEPRFRVQGLGFRVQGYVGFRVQGFGFRIMKQADPKLNDPTSLYPLTTRKPEDPHHQGLNTSGQYPLKLVEGLG